MKCGMKGNLTSLIFVFLDDLVSFLTQVINLENLNQRLMMEFSWAIPQGVRLTGYTTNEQRQLLNQSM